VSKEKYKKQTRLIDVLNGLYGNMSQAENIDVVGKLIRNFITGDKSTPATK